MNRETFQRPRVLAIDLAALERGEPVAIEAWRDEDPGLDLVGTWGGSALCSALVLQAVRRRPVGVERAPLVLALGLAVRERLPTAARVCVGGRSPLTGGYVEGQVGSDLARRLASVTDALVIDGRCSRSSCVLWLDARGAASVVSMPRLAGRSPRETGDMLREHFGACGILCIGPAGEARVAFASLASGAEPPSFVGRGGLGALLGSKGLKAVVVSAPASEVSAPAMDGASGDRARGDGAAGDGAPTAAARALSALLGRSPRLRARSESGTLELAAAFAARGEPGAPAWETDELALALDAGRSRKGCAGCPTPCGIVLERGDAGASGAHFSALEGFASQLGFSALDAGLALLEGCDRLGLDAIESAHVLALLRRAGRIEASAGVETFVGALEELVLGRTPLAARGALACARSLGLEHELRAVRGQSVRGEESRASQLGLLASARGGDPMRTLSFLAGDSPSRDALARLLAPEVLREGAEDPRDARGKGQLVWWSENLANALDASGFCAFSASALLLDGVATLDELGEVLAPPAARRIENGASPGRQLLAAGASIALAQRELAWELAPDRGLVPERSLEIGATAPALAPSEEWLRCVREHPQGWPEYALRRGLDAHGRPTARAWARIGSVELLELLSLEREPDDGRARAVAAAATRPREPGRVLLRASGALARRLGRERSFAHSLPCSLSELLRALAASEPDCAAWLVLDGRIVPASYRDGRRVDAEDAVHDGDVLDLVVAISGG